MECDVGGLTTAQSDTASKDKHTLTQSALAQLTHVPFMPGTRQIPPPGYNACCLLDLLYKLCVDQNSPPSVPVSQVGLEPSISDIQGELHVSCTSWFPYGHRRVHFQFAALAR